MASALRLRALVGGIFLLLFSGFVGLLLGGFARGRLWGRAVAAQSWGGGGSPPPVKSHQRFAAFISGDGFYSDLLLQNLQAKSAVTVSSTIILSSGQIPLGSVTVPPHSAQTLDISAAVWNHGYSSTRGTVMIQYSTVSYSQVTAVARSYDDATHVYLNSFAQSPEAYWMGTAYDAVLWAPDEGTKGLVFLTNSSSQPRQVSVTLLANGSEQNLTPIEIPPDQTQWVPIDALVSEGHSAGAGVHVSFSGNPGDILAGGLLYNDRTGFAKYIHFADGSLPYSTAALRTNLVLLGPQPPDEGYPAVSFRSVAAVRNTQANPVSVAPKLIYQEGGQTEGVALPGLTLPPYGSAIIDLTKEQADGIIPAVVNEAALELQPNGASGGIVAEMFSYDGASGGYVVGPSFTSYPAHGTASEWRIDGDFTATVIVGNTAAQSDKLVLRLFSAAGLYAKTFAIPAGGLLSIDVKQLQQDATPDDSGNLLSGTSGIMYLSGSRNNLTKLTFDVIVHSTNEADYVGYQNNPCDMVEAVYLYTDCQAGFDTCGVMQQWDWSLSGAADQAATGTGSSNTSLAQISQNSSGDDQVTFMPPSGGQSQNVTLYYGDGSVNAPNCEACSWGPVPVESDTETVPSLTLHGNQYNSLFVGTDPNLAGANSIFATVSPSGGTFTEQSSNSGDTFSNVQSGGPGWVVTTTTPSTSTGDRIITVTYTVSGDAPVSASLSDTAREFAYATDSNLGNVCSLGYGYLYDYVYTPYTHPDKTAVPPGLGLDGTAVAESFSPQLPSGSGWATSGGALTVNSQFIDHLGACSTSPLSISTTTTTQSISIEGYPVRQNSLTFSDSALTYVNKGPTQ